MPTNDQLSTDRIREALQLSEQIDQLQQRLDAILGGSGSAATPASSSAPAAKTKAASTGGRRGMSAEAREKIAAAQRARWAKQKKSNGTPASAKPKAAASAPARQAKRTLSPEARAKMAEAARKRWAAKKGA